MRTDGMRRALAALTMACVLGPRHQLVAELAQPAELTGHVEGAIVDGRQDELAAGAQAGLGEAMVQALDDHAVDAALAGLARAAVADRQVGQGLQLEGDVLEHVAHPGTVA